MIFTELSITERVQRIDDLGSQVEIWDWTRQDIDKLQAIGATFLVDDRLCNRRSDRS
jgi:hydroxypyruvate isomerase